MKKNYIEDWNNNYLNRRFNVYPFSDVVSFILRNFNVSKREDINILDLGCGGGNHIKFLLEEGFDYYGVDGSSESINLTKKLISSNKKNKKLFVAEFTNLPFKNDFLDCIIDRQSIGHNTKINIKKIIEEVHRTLKKGGRIHSHVFGTMDSGFSFGENSGDNDFYNFSGGHFKNSHMVHAFSYQEIQEFFKSFSNIKVEKKHFFLEDNNNPNSEIFVINATK